MPGTAVCAGAAATSSCGLGWPRPVRRRAFHERKTCLFPLPGYAAQRRGPVSPALASQIRTPQRNVRLCHTLMARPLRAPCARDHGSWPRMHGRSLSWQRAACLTCTAAVRRRNKSKMPIRMTQEAKYAQHIVRWGSASLTARSTLLPQVHLVSTTHALTRIAVWHGHEA